MFDVRVVNVSLFDEVKIGYESVVIYYLIDIDDMVFIFDLIFGYC